MRLVYKFYIPHTEQIDALCRTANNLYNQALYLFRQRLDADGTWIAVRWNDPLRHEQAVKRISLAGFTRCYDEVLRRYGVKRKK